MQTTHLKDPSLSYIGIFVVSLHVILIFWMALSIQARPRTPHIAKRLVVQTVALAQPPKAQPVQSKPSVPEPVDLPLLQEAEVPAPAAKPVVSAPKPADPPVVEVKEQPKPVKPKPNPKPAAKPKKVAEKKKPKPAPVVENKKKPETKPVDRTQIKNKELLAKAQESIAKIQATSDKISASKAANLPELKIPQLKSTSRIGDEGMAGWSSAEIGYRDELASRLKLQLRLPEYGEVKVKLTLTRAGRFVKVAVVSSESKANRQYIEKSLPALTFPPFGQNFEKTDEYTFSITLSNDL